MFTLTKEAAIEKNTPENWFGTCQRTTGIFGRHRRTKVVALDDLNRLIDARFNIWFLYVLVPVEPSFMGNHYLLRVFNVYC